MKFLRVGELHNEIPAILDKNKQIRDISSIIKDLNPETINQKTINKLNQSNVENLPIIKEPIRIGACVSRPEKFIGIGLNYSDHAAETGMEPPKEPIIFMKANSSISGP